MKAILCPVVAVLLTLSLTAQTTHKSKAKSKAAAVTADDVKALPDALAAKSSANRSAAATNPGLEAVAGTP